MDYSLLLGFHKGRQELVVGLVDYMRQYTWDKQIESWVKSSGLLGGAGKEPTIVSPRQYARRFQQAVLSYLTVVPRLLKPPDLTRVDEGAIP
jgi:1-phosphatidylinositol-3-phosphate 5-kinase